MNISALTPDKQVKLQYWLDVIRQCRASGLTNQAWCEQHNISLKKLLLLDRKDPETCTERTAPKESCMQADYGTGCTAARHSSAIYRDILTGQTDPLCHSRNSTPYRFCDS